MNGESKRCLALAAAHGTSGAAAPQRHSTRATTVPLRVSMDYETSAGRQARRLAAKLSSSQKSSSNGGAGSGAFSGSGAITDAISNAAVDAFAAAGPVITASSSINLSSSLSSSASTTGSVGEARGSVTASGGGLPFSGTPESAVSDGSGASMRDGNSRGSGPRIGNNLLWSASASVVRLGEGSRAERNGRLYPAASSVPSPSTLAARLRARSTLASVSRGGDPGTLAVAAAATPSRRSKSRSPVRALARSGNAATRGILRVRIQSAAPSYSRRVARSRSIGNLPVAAAAGSASRNGNAVVTPAGSSSRGKAVVKSERLSRAGGSSASGSSVNGRTRSPSGQAGGAGGTGTACRGVLVSVPGLNFLGQGKRG